MDDTRLYYWYKYVEKFSYRSKRGHDSGTNHLREKSMLSLGVTST